MHKTKKELEKIIENLERDEFLNVYSKFTRWLMSLGFRQDGIFRDDVFKNGEFKNILLFSILRSEIDGQF